MESSDPDGKGQEMLVMHGVLYTQSVEDVIDDVTHVAPFVILTWLNVGGV